MTGLSAEQVRRLRTQAQYLRPRVSAGDLIKVAQSVSGIQAQQTAAMMLALRARVRGLTIAQVDVAIARHRLVRTWLMRGTLHLSAADDVGWMLGLLSPTFIASGKRRREQLGLDDDTSAKGLKLLESILSDRPMTRGEIVEALAERGLALDRRSQAPIHLIGLAALRGITLLGADRPKGESTFVLTDKWIDSAEKLPEDKAVAQFVWRYLLGYAPADVKDFMAWSGLPSNRAQRGFDALIAAGDIVEAQVEQRRLWLPKAMLTAEIPDPQTEQVVRLLPAFDSYVLGYKDRDLVVAPQHKGEVYHGGQTVPIVLVDGAAAGVWRHKRQGKRLQITVHAFESFDPSIKYQIAGEADDIGRFWDVPAAVNYSDKPL